MPRKLLSLLLFCFVLKFSYAQSYPNNWIDYSKSYYKFRLGPFGYDIVGAPVTKGVVRISQTALNIAGLGSVPSENFQLWHDGKEVTLYISKPSGILSPDDFIEFWGETEDGKADKSLYSDSTFQLSDHWNLETDSSSWFLTINAGGNNKKFNSVNNNVSSTTLQPEKNFMFTAGRYFRYGINEGYGIFSGKNLYSSSYERGEGWSSRPVHPVECDCGQLTLPQTFPQLFLDIDGDDITASVNMVGNAPNDRNVQVYLNDALLAQINMGYFLSEKLQLPGIAANTIINDTATISVQDISDAPDDELRVAQIEFTYPRKFNFGDASDFEFYIAPSANGRYLKISNFSTNGVAPILYDVANNKRYVGDISITDTVQFVLRPSSKRYHLVLIRGDGSTATFITNFQPRSFTDFSKTEDQGNYLIISNPIIYGTAPANYVEHYRRYRSSEKGGSYNAKIIDIHELEDQFAYGIKMHPLAIKDFLKYARNTFVVPPAFVFIIGKGVSYSAYRPYDQDPIIDQLNLVPVFGSPGSDNLLSSKNFDAVPATPIGRLSVVSPEEVRDYLAKVKRYEAAQQDSTQTIENKGWMKNVLQLTGANDPGIGTILDTIASKYKRIISDTLFGANVINYSKTADPAGYPQALVNFGNTFNNGCSLLEYFGHSSSTGLDFSLEDPSNYDNKGKYPFFIVNGCLAGNIFDFDATRLTNRTTISERFVLEPQKGAIAYLSTSSYGVLSYLDIFTRQFYKSMSETQYGKGLGEIVQEGIDKGLRITGASDFYGRIHAEQYTLHGDPALRMNSFDKPDFAIETDKCEVLPSFISTADSSFTVKIRIYNIGRSTNDSVHFSLFKQNGRGDSLLVFAKEFPFIKTVDSVIVRLPIIPDKDKGVIKLFATIDDNKSMTELSENNNSANIVFTISTNETRPIFPYNYSIVNTPAVNLSASTANPLDTVKQYLFEMDTTALFNSPAKVVLSQSSGGGLLQFMNVPLTEDNRVYYWRVAAQDAKPHWNMFSFIHKNGNPDGFEQAHYFQQTASSFNNMMLDSSRQFSFAKKLTNLFVLQSIYPTSGLEDNDFSVSVNGSYVAASACVGHSVIFNIFDPLTFKPVANTTDPYGAADACKPLTVNDFEFSVTEPESRKNAMDFLDHFVPDGYYVVVRKIYDDWADNGIWAPTVWASDSALYGPNNSLYHRFKDQGLAIDSFYFPRTFVFVFKKNDSTNYKPISVFSEGFYDKITLSENISTTNMGGFFTSPAFGPANAWGKVTWNGYDINSNNTASLDVIGINNKGKDSVFYTLDKSQSQVDISGIQASRFSFIKLRMNSTDSTTAIPHQLQDWSVEYTPVPEGAVAPNLGISIPHKISFSHDVNVAFDTLQGYVVFKNISTRSFKPLKLKLVLYDDNNIPYEFRLPRTGILLPGDTLHVSFLINVTAMPAGKYNLFIAVNADNAQPEQFYFNNLLYKFLQIERTSFAAPVFTAQPSGKNVLLKWNVNDETIFDHYEVEFSEDGSLFIHTENVGVSFTDKRNADHSFVHTSPVMGRNYYRLKTVYNDGRFIYSPVRIINFDDAAVKIYPNPFFNTFNIISGKTGGLKTTVRIFDPAGKQLMQQSFEGSVSLNVSTFAAGTYLVQVDDGKNIQSFKVQKQK